MIGPEYDHYTPGASPENLQVLAHSLVDIGWFFDHADTSYYSAPSGAGVFASASIWWVGHLHPVFLGAPQSDFVLKSTLNVLREFGTGPTGRPSPPVRNVPS